MSLKKITSLTMLLSMLAMTFTGILLFITPPGRVANWTNWQIFGLTKELIANIHSTFMVLFVAILVSILLELLKFPEQKHRKVSIIIGSISGVCYISYIAEFTIRAILS